MKWIVKNEPYIHGHTYVNEYKVLPKNIFLRFFYRIIMLDMLYESSERKEEAQKLCDFRNNKVKQEKEEVDGLMAWNKKLISKEILDALLLLGLIYTGLEIITWGVKLFLNNGVVGSIFISGGLIFCALILVWYSLKQIDNRLNFGAGYNLNYKIEEGEEK